MTSSHAPRAAWPGALVRRLDAQLFLTSFLGLYLELLCIRWMPAQIRFLAYFTNFILLASLLGLGIGILSARSQRGLSPKVFPCLLLLIAIFVATARFDLPSASIGILFHGASESDALPTENMLVLPSGFLLVALMFVYVGRPLGILLTELTPPLRAYALDIAGSLAGIMAFFLLSLTEQPPAVWFIGLLAIVALLAGPRWYDRVIMLGPLVLAVVIAGSIGLAYWWSPYYRIGLDPVMAHPQGQEPISGWLLSVNSISHQLIMPAEKKEPFYHKPYALFSPREFQRVLIIGAGSGTDMAIALRNGSSHVDAVEIDPVIVRLGAMIHPDHPFADPRVTVHIDDGRAFLRNTNERYDLILFALTDSLTLTSQYANLRLESFLFTEDAFREARDHLTSDGVLALYNYYRDPWLVWKLASMLESAFDRPPYLITYGAQGHAAVLLNGPGLSSLLTRRPDLAQPYQETTALPPPLEGSPGSMRLPVTGSGLLGSRGADGERHGATPAPATDDWPMLYLREPVLPALYVGGLTMVVVIALVLLLAYVPRSILMGFNGHMFFLGVAFMLLETRSLVTFSLLFGTTWLVNSLVFFAVLGSVMVAIAISARWRIAPSPPLYGLLLASLLLAYLLPPDALLSIEVAPLRYTLASVIAFLPIVLANLIFAGSFKLTGSMADVAFASNLLGIMVGGMLEYTALIFGYRWLLLLVIVFYVVSALLLHRWPLPSAALIRGRG